MFNLFNKKPAGTKITLKLKGLHCSSCSLSIDSDLEDLPGVISTSTSYVKQESTIVYDPKIAKREQFVTVIQKLGYTIIS